MNEASDTTAPPRRQSAAKPPSRKRGRPAGQASRQLTATIIDVALRHFLLSGFEATSIMQIARDAGVSRQLLHQKFGGKEQLFEAVMREREARFLAVEQLKLPPDNGSLRDGLVAFGDAMVAHLLQPWRIELERLLYAGLHRFPTMAARQREGQQKITKQLAAFIAQGLDGAERDRFDAVPAAEDLRNLLFGESAPVVLGITPAPTPAERRRRVEALIDRFMLTLPGRL